MARYTTEPGICAVEEHPIEDAPETRGLGYKSPKPPLSAGGGGIQLKERLCREHFIEAFRETQGVDPA